MAPFNLFGVLRVLVMAESGEPHSGEPLGVIQRDRKNDPDFFVILPRPLAWGEKYTIMISDSGKTRW